MINNKSVTFVFFVMILFPVLDAHEVLYETIKEKGIGLIVKYDTGEPMIGAEVTIYSPENYKIPYLKTITDPQGCFLFLPNRLGKWAIIVNDNAGHGVQKTIEIKKNFDVFFLIIQRLFMGLCIVWGLIGTYLFYKQRKTVKTC